MGYEIYKGDEKDKTVKSQKDLEHQIRLKENLVAGVRLGRIISEGEPESSPEVGLESDHGRNSGSKDNVLEPSSIQEAALMRRKQVAAEETRANDIRRSLGLPEQAGSSETKEGVQPGISPEREKTAPMTQEGGSSFRNVPIIPNAKQYLEDLTGRGDSSRVANLDRSKIFRHPEDFAVFEEVVRQILARNPEKPIKFLDVGIGNLEEPLSFLSVINNKTKDAGRSLEEIFDLRMVDIRNKEDISIKKGLGKTYMLGQSGIGAAFMTEDQKASTTRIPQKPPDDQRHSFVLSADSGEYEFLPEVVEYAQKTLADPSKTSLSTPIENYLANISDTEQFDFIAFNNVAQHLGGNEYPNPFQKKELSRKAYDKFYQVVESLLRRVQKDGIIFMHTPTDLGDKNGSGGARLVSAEVSFFRDNFEELKPGVFRRK